LKVIRVELPELLTERDARLAITIEMFRCGLVSVGKAAEIAGIPLQKFVGELSKRGGFHILLQRRGGSKGI